MNKPEIKKLNFHKLMFLIIGRDGDYVYSEVAPKEYQHQQAYRRLLNNMTNPEKEKFGTVLLPDSNTLYDIVRDYTNKGFIIFARNTAFINDEVVFHSLYLPSSITDIQEVQIQATLEKMLIFRLFYISKNEDEKIKDISSTFTLTPALAIKKASNDIKYLVEAPKTRTRKK